MKSILMLVTLALSTLGSHAQTSTQTVQNNIDRIADSGITTSELMIGLPPPMPRVLGSVYLRDSMWNVGEIWLKANKKNYKNVSVRFNLYNNQLEIATGKDIRALDAKLIENFSWLGPKGSKQEFILMSNLKTEGRNYSGIGEVL